MHPSDIHEEMGFPTDVVPSLDNQVSIGNTRGNKCSWRPTLYYILTNILLNLDYLVLQLDEWQELIITQPGEGCEQEDKVVAGQTG